MLSCHEVSTFGVKAVQELEAPKGAVSGGYSKEKTSNVL